jgi:uncharacterized protein
VIQPAFHVLFGVVDEVYSIGVGDVERAKAIVYGKARLSARDAIHLAVMERNEIETIMSFDSGFDGYPRVTRLAS